MSRASNAAEDAIAAVEPANAEADIAAISRAQVVASFAPDGRLLDANDNFLALFGYSRTEALGLQHAALTPALTRETLDYRGFWDKLAHGEVDAGRYVRVAKSGREVWLNGSYAPVRGPDGAVARIIVTALDVSAEKPAAEAALFNANCLKAIDRTRASMDLTLSGEILDANAFFLRISGYSVADLQGRPLNTLLEPSYGQSQAYRDLIDRLARGEPQSGAFQMTHRDGRLIWVQAIFNVVMDADERPYRVRAYMTDVTEQKAADLEAHFKGSAFNGASVAMMMVDRDLKVLHVNDATRALFTENLAAFRAVWPSFDPNRIVGTCIDVFHKHPEHQRRLLADPSRLPYKTDIVVADLRFALHVTAVTNAHGDYVGNVLEWANVTQVRVNEGQLKAIDRSQAVIEFDLTGKVLHANENFLNTLGYSLSEVVGKHHSNFVDPAYAQSPEYRRFWDKLAAGEYDAGQYKRIAKGGREVWIQASYNPILDQNGRAFKVVKYATDITSQKLQAADYEGQLAAISKSQAVIEFGLDGRIQTANENFLKTLGYTLDEIKEQHHSLFVDPAERQTPEYRAFWEKLGRGEYDAGQYKRIGKGGREVWIQASYNPIFDLNGKAIKVVKYATDVTPQRKVGERVKEIAGIVASASSEMRATAEQMSTAAAEANGQATAVAAAARVATGNVETVSAAGEELAASISEIARQVTESTAITQLAVAETDKTSVAIQTLAEAAQKIGNVVTLINNIAGQTKLLALNATIEAARAGDAGKGFAVVASEVKSLSDQTAKATLEISSQVTAMQAATNTSVQAINEIANTIRKVADIATTISSAVEEQSAATAEISTNVVEAANGTRDVSQNIVGVTAAVAQTSAASTQLLGASGELAVQAEALNAEMERLLR